MKVFHNKMAVRALARLAGFRFFFSVVTVAMLAGCASAPELESVEPGQSHVFEEAPSYRIGPGDTVNIFVWENPELSVSLPVRPDGRISTPLVEDLRAAGRTPTGLARAMEDRLSTYIKNPVVSVMVTGFAGLPSSQIRVVGEAAEPQALPYREGMTVLDVMIRVGGLTEFAAGNDAALVREVGGQRKEFEVRLGDLLRDGEIEANAPVEPGDILIIPEAWF